MIKKEITQGEAVAFGQSLLALKGACDSMSKVLLLTMGKDPEAEQKVNDLFNSCRNTSRLIQELHDMCVKTCNEGDQSSTSE